MKLNDISITDLLASMENAPELFRLNKYQNKEFIETYVPLFIQRNGFYGQIKSNNEIIPLKTNKVSFESEEDVVLLVEGFVSIKSPLTITGGGAIVLKGYGILEVNGVPIFDGRADNMNPPTSDDIANDSNISGASVTQALNTLGNDLDNLENDFTSLSTDGVANNSNVAGATSTNALNNLKLEVDDLKDNTFKVTYYEILDISATTVGSLQETPTGATINENQFGESGNSVLSTVTVSSTPTYESPLVGEVPVTVNLGVNGSWVASNTYPNPVALIYSFTIEFGDWNNVSISKIVDYYQLETGLKDLAYKDKTELGDYEDDSIVGSNLANNTVTNDKAALMTSWSLKANPTDNPSQPQDLNASSVVVGTPSHLFGFDSLGKFVKLLTPIFSPIQSVFGRTNPNIVAMLGDYTTALVTEVTDKRYTTDAQQVTLSNTSNVNSGDETDTSIETKYEGLPNTNKYTDAEKSKLASLESSKFLGKYLTLNALELAHTFPAVGSYGDVDAGVGDEVKRYIWDSDDLVFVLQLGESATLTDAQVKTQYENNADTNALTDARRNKIDALTGTNTGDETTVSIQNKRQIKTVNGVSLEGTGNIVISAFDTDAEGVLTKYVPSQRITAQTTNSTAGVTYLTLITPAVIGAKYLAILSFGSSHSSTNNRTFVDVKDFGVSILPQRYELEPKDNVNTDWTTRLIELIPNPLSGGQFQLQIDFGSTNLNATTTMHSATLILLKVPV